MKKLTLLVLLSITFWAANAQRKPHQGPNRMQEGHKKEHRSGKQKMAQVLNLSADQKQQMKSINQEGRKKMEELNANQNLTVKELNDRRSAIRKEMRDKRNALFTKEQKDKLADMKSKREKQKNDCYAQKMSQLKQKAGLSDDQVSRMNALREKTRNEVEKIKNNDKLNDMEKRNQIKTMVQNARKDRLNMLTKEQLVTMMSERQHKKREDRFSEKK